MYGRLAVGEASVLARQHLDIGQAMMTEGDRLRRLQMREAWHHRRRVQLRLLGEGKLKIRDQRLDLIDLVSDIEAEISGDLIVPRPRRMQSAGGRADQP